MPRITNKIYVVSFIDTDGRKLYYVRQKSNLIYEGGMVSNEPIGIFSYDLMDGKKFMDKASAEWCASYFEGAGVEVIASGERLK